MKASLFFALSFFSLQVFGQDSSPSLLHVSGQAEVSVKPTLSVVTLTIRSSGDSYAGAVENLVNRVDMLTIVLSELKFKEEEILTSNFSVEKNFVYVQGERKEKGFNGLQTLKVQFVQEKERLLRVLTAVANSDADPEVTVSFDLDNEQKAKLKDELLREAVKDAQSKAQLIADQANQQIIGIQDIKYGIGNSTIPSPVAFSAMKAESRAGADFSNFEAANLTFSDQVLMVFKIAPR